MTGFFIAALIGITTCLAIGYIIGNRGRRIAELEQRVTELEKQNGRRHTHNTLNGIFDANAINVDVILLLQEALLIARNRLKQATKILGETSENPYSYQDRPSGKDQAVEEAHRELADLIKDMQTMYEAIYQLKGKND
jgi:hypothetical protein